MPCGDVGRLAGQGVRGNARGKEQKLEDLELEVSLIDTYTLFGAGSSGTTGNSMMTLFC